MPPSIPAGTSDVLTAGFSAGANSAQVDANESGAVVKFSTDPLAFSKMTDVRTADRGPSAPTSTAMPSRADTMPGLDEADALAEEDMSTHDYQVVVDGKSLPSMTKRSRGEVVFDAHWLSALGKLSMENLVECLRDGDRAGLVDAGFRFLPGVRPHLL
eukprot:7386434-Prymnesium_polylepis.1